MIHGTLAEKLLIDLAQFTGHSIWTGFLSAAIYFLYIKSSARLSPEQRVNYGLILLLAAPVLAGFFTMERFIIIPFPASLSLSVPFWLIQYLCGIWVIGFTIQGFRLLAGLVQTQRIRKGCQPIDKQHDEMLRPVCNQLAISSKLPVTTNARIKAPIICGFRRPMIIIPKTALQQADKSCLESIIAHEAAHFVRRDLWINLGQSILDAIYFYHPAMRWMSRQVRIERENACDDFAVAALNGKRFAYAAALLETETIVSNNGALYAAFGSESTSDRAARIAFGEKSDRKPFSGAIAILMLLIVILMSASVVAASKILSVKIVDEMPPVIKSIEIDPPRYPDFGTVVNTNFEWQDKQIGNRGVPMLKSVPLIERDGIVYDPAKPEPRLFEEVPNAWLVDHQLDLLNRHLLRTDPDLDQFTVLEEFEHGTHPNDASSHPERVHLLTFVSRQSKLCRIKYAARTDQDTVQLIRIPTNEYPNRLSYFIKAGETSPDGRIQVKEINDESILLHDLPTNQSVEVKKQKTAEFRTWYAELAVRNGSESFYVKKGEEFYIPGFSDRKWRLKHVSEKTCKVTSINSKTVVDIPVK